MPGSAGPRTCYHDRVVRVVPIAAGRQDVSHCHAMALRWLFLASLLLYVLTAGSNFTSGDAYAELRVAQSLVDHGWFDEAASPKCTPGSGYGEPGTDGRCYATHGIGYSLLLLPAYLLAKGTIAAFWSPIATPGPTASRSIWSAGPPAC